jgi:uncharacterized protein (DUF2126 family)
MKVTRVWEAPRVTKPYSEEQWAGDRNARPPASTPICSLPRRAPDHGRRADLRLDRRPRWRRVEHRRPRPDKRVRASRPLSPPARQVRPGGLLHFGQGKWYPGEQLPRWSLNCFWRKRRPADVEQSGAVSPTKPATTAPTKSSPGASWPRVAERLGLDPKPCLSRPTRTPSTTCGANAACRATSIPFDARLDDPLERDRLRRCFATACPTRRLRAAAQRSTPTPAPGRPGRGSCATSAAI